MAKDLTQGPITSQLVAFTVPLVLGNVFQMAYNAADSIIVGRMVGPEALAAVGICNPLSTLMILFLNGLCIGAGILMGTQFGAKQYDTLKRQISTTMLSGVAFSAMLSLICIVFAFPILRLLRVEESIIGMTAEYMRIIFAGLVFTFLYNFFACTLRALGDSKTPLYFLVLSSLLNIAGDLFFVVALKLGSMGCAISTVLSEMICCLMCILYIQKKVELLRLGRGWLLFDRSLLRQTVAYGWASAAQQATVQAGKIAIQALANSMGIAAAAAFTAVNRIDDFAYTPEQNISHAMSSFMAQNRGAGKRGRMVNGFFAGIRLEVIYAAVVFAIGFFFRTQLMGFFSKDESVIRLGASYQLLSAPMYFLPALTNGLQGYFRGIGRLRITLAASMINMGLRVLVAFILVSGFAQPLGAIPWGNFAGWAGMLVLEIPLIRRDIAAHRAAAGEKK